MLKNATIDSKEYRNYHSKPAARKARSKRVTARRKMEKAGKVSKGDGKDVDHKRALSKGGGNGKSNLRVSSRSSNRSRNGHRKGEKQSRKR